MQDIIQRMRESLSELYPDTEITSLSRLVIEHVTGLAFPVFLSDKNTKITAAQEQIIDKIVQRLQTSEPIQYILGETEFFGLPITVNPDVLIPRPETEELVELVLSENKNTVKQILDIGTGSGCIAIAIAKYLPQSTIEAWDFSKKALDTAKLNAQKSGVDIVFRQVDVLSDYSANRYFDIVISNPPYVLDSEKADMSQNVLENEPHSALFVPDHDALIFYKRIAEIGKDLFTKNGKLYFEINRAKGEEVVDMLEQKGYENIQLIKDISGNDRIVKAEYVKAL